MFHVRRRRATWTCGGESHTKRVVNCILQNCEIGIVLNLCKSYRPGDPPTRW